jgi:non-specific serine/threonine protein kinase
MGLGKTIQVLDLLQQEHTDVSKLRKSTSKSGPDDPSLLLVPASLLGNWRQECEKFTPRLRMRFAHRSEGDEAILRALEDPKAPLPDCDVLVTTYNMVRRLKGFETRSWRMLILDEAQAIKNPGSLQTRAIKKLKAQSRLVMTGTPIENQIGDLWSLFDFCSPGLLGTQTAFKKTIQRLNKQEENAAYAAVRRLVRPYILRRLKTDPQIVPDLPEKTEVTTSCLLSRKQATLYKKVVTDLSQVLKGAEGIQRRGLVLGSLMQLKQICNHPDHFLGGTEFGAQDSGKFQRLAELCEPIRERQERLLVFTQFQALTEPLAEYLGGLFNRSGLVLHGGTPVKRRKELVADFQAEDGPPFFVISVKAGGVGLNLTAASHVIHFDRWWNPAVENQATDRAFRIGQKRNVLVHKFVCRGTLEERIDQTLREKQTLSDNILNVDGQVLLTEMSNEQLLDFVSLDFNRAVESDA